MIELSKTSKDGINVLILISRHLKLFVSWCALFTMIFFIYFSDEVILPQKQPDSK